MRKSFYRVFLAILGLGISVFLFFCRGYGNLLKLTDRLCLLSDALAVPGVIFLGAGILLHTIGDSGLFGLAYTLRWTVETLLPLAKKKHITYREYRDQARGKASIYCRPLILAGCIFLLPAVILAIEHYKIM